MKKQIEKIKSHVKRNRTAYITGGVCLVVGVAGGITAAGVGRNVVNARAIQVLTWKSKQTIEVFVEALGDPGNIIQDITTGIVYASQGQAARELGVNPARISEHLGGKIPNVNGHMFKILGKAGVPEA